MSLQSQQFIKKMLEFLPETYNKYQESIEYNYGMILETVIIEDVFQPEIIKLLIKNEKTELLINIFKYFEEISNSEDQHIINIFTTTILEGLGDDRKVLNTAQNYLGFKTRQLQAEADRKLGRL